jgi:hypothetical protein
MSETRDAVREIALAYAAKVSEGCDPDRMIEAAIREALVPYVSYIDDLNALCACYRTGKRPSEALLDRLAARKEPK